MSYLKIEDNQIVEPPYVYIRNHKVIYGYNKQSNQSMLFEDGYSKFPKSIINYQIKNGQIVEKQPVPPEKPTIFTKLQIRRAMRKLQIEDRLDILLNSSQTIFKDWNDAQEISLNDPIFKYAIAHQLIDQATIDQIIQEILKDENTL